MRSILKEREHLSRQLRLRYKRSRKEVVDDFDEEGIQKAIYAMYGRPK